jgi:hypothetical protein
MPAVGRMDGDKAVAIIAKALLESDLTGMFAEGLEHVTESEREIDAAQLVATINSSCIPTSRRYFPRLGGVFF